MPIPAEACSVIAEAGQKLAKTLRRFFRVGSARNWIDQPLLDAQREDALDTVAVTVCRLGRLLRLVRGAPDDLGRWRKELLNVIHCFDLILLYYGWRDDPGGPWSMDDPAAWRAHWPVKWPFIPYIRSELLDALERAGQTLQEAVQAAPVAIVPDQPANVEPANLNETESNILEALGQMTMTGEKIAAKAGYPFNSNFRKTLSHLKKRGILDNQGRGYFRRP